MTDDQKREADCLIEFAKLHADHLRQTRDMEVKINLALWTLIVLFAHALRGKLPFGGWALWVYVGAAVIIAFGHLMLWMLPVQLSEDRDWSFVDLYKARVGELTGSNLTEPSAQEAPQTHEARPMDKSARLASIRSRNNDSPACRCWGCAGNRLTANKLVLLTPHPPLRSGHGAADHRVG